jgi:two-component system sensor histidine kinase UhpB
MDRALENKDETWQVEYRFKTNNEDYRYVIDRGYVMYDEHNKPYRLIGSMIDITERKMLEEKLARQEIKRQRQITEATILGQEKERTEIGRELHDNINQILTTTKLYLDLAINEPEIRDEILPKCYNNISNTIEELRMLSKTLVPPSLGDIGIVEAINEMINDIERTGRLKIKFQSRGVESPAMDSQLKLMVFRIVQEQINNILKHAEAETATINLNFNTNALNLSIIDNGKGFDPTQKARGIGLNNIACRAELYNGVMEINSAPGKGCTLTVTIPIN